VSYVVTQLLSERLGFLQTSEGLPNLPELKHYWSEFEPNVDCLFKGRVALRELLERTEGLFQPGRGVPQR
jgi:hypothetical protein